MLEIAGTGTDSYLGYGWKGWWFWVYDFRLCNLLMGFDTPLAERLFAGKRKRWEGAREAIFREEQRAREITRTGKGFFASEVEG